MNKKIFITLIFLISISTSIYGKDIKEEIIDRCRTQMGTYGATLVKACVDQDMEAVLYLGRVLENDNHKSIVSRCMNQMKSYGYSLVKACVEQDIESEKALSNY